MTRSLFFLMLILSFNLKAETIDQKLDSYIKLFNLKALETPGKKNPALFELGKELFSEKRISGNNNISCADCHHADSFTTDSLPLGLGEGADGIGVLRNQKKGHMLGRNTPALFNLGYSDIKSMFWDGRIQYNPATKVFYTPDNGLNGMNPRLGHISRVMTSALAAQAIFPMANDLEMKGQPGTNEIANAKTNEEAWLKITTKILSMEKYKKLISKAFPQETSYNIGHLAEAIAEFERFEFLAINTPYDQYLRGDKNALTHAQKFGMMVFFDKGKCGACHMGEHLSNFDFKNVGVPQIGPDPLDLGRASVVNNDNMKYAFRVPPLRNVALTAPYFHNGSFQNLAQVVEHYDDIETSLNSYNWITILNNYNAALRGHDHSNDQDRLDHLAHNVSKNLFFEEFEEHALVEFMTNALTDPKYILKEDQKRYTTEFRLQFTKAGFEKIKKAFADVTPAKKTYYYFDTYSNKSYQLRKLARPIKVVMIKDHHSSKSVLNYREVRRKLFAAATTATGDYYISADLVDEKDSGIDSIVTNEVAASFDNFFNILYSFYNPEIQSPIPASSLLMMRKSLDTMDDNFHAANFAGKNIILDRLGMAEDSEDKLTYAPTSVNVKEVYKKHIWLNNRLFVAELLKTNMRDEKGGHYVTYALEIQSSKLPENHLQKATNDVIAFIQDYNVIQEDFDDFNPSPSNLTLTILNQLWTE